jgi:hypothetical protein
LTIYCRFAEALPMPTREMNAMPYEVLSNGDGTYSVLQNSAVVQGAEVKKISFPSTTSHTLHGAVHHIAGQCVAKIDVPNEGIVNDVPVKFPKP